MQFGIVGLGRIGGGMAVSLARAGHQAFGYDIDPEAGRRAAANGVAVCGSLAALVERAEVVATSLATLEAIELTYFGDGGVPALARPGLTTIECSTVSPAFARRVSASQARAGVPHLEACVIGLEPDAHAGNLFYLLSGDEGIVERVRPLLDSTGRGFVHVGPSGSAAVAKLLNNSIGYVTQTAIAEAMAVCRREGLDPAAFADAVIEGARAGYSVMFERHGRGMAAMDPAAQGSGVVPLKDANALGELIRAPSDAYPALSSMIETFREALHDTSRPSQTSLARHAESRSRRR